MSWNSNTTSEREYAIKVFRKGIWAKFPQMNNLLMYQKSRFKCKIPSIALTHGIGSSSRAGHEHKWNWRTASVRSTDILQPTLAPCKRHKHCQEDIIYLKCTFADDTKQVFSISYRFLNYINQSTVIICYRSKSILSFIDWSSLVIAKHVASNTFDEHYGFSMEKTFAKQ